LRAADVVLFVVRSALDDVIALQHRLQTLDFAGRQARAGVVAVGEHPYRLDELAGAFSLPVIGALAWDPKAADALSEGRRPAGSSKLLRTAAGLAADVAAQLPPPTRVADEHVPGLSTPDARVPSARWEPSRTNGADLLPSTGERSVS
jgi:hypothetical protein